MKKRVLFVVLALVMVMAFALTGCGGGSATTTSSAATTSEAAASTSEAAATTSEAAATSDEGGAAVNSALVAGADETYYMITFASGLDFWKGCYKGFQTAAALYGAKTEYTGTTGDDASDEAKILDTVAGTKPAGIAITAVNSDALKEPIANAMKAGVPVVCFDSDSADSGRLSFLALDNYQGGRVVGKTIADLIGGKGTISGTLVPGAQNLEDRWRGVRDVISESYPDITIIDPVNGKYDQAEGAKQTSALLTAHPEITGLFACDASAGVAVGTALKELGKTSDDVKVVAFDTEPGTMEFLKDGTLAATILQGRPSMGYWSFQFLYAVNHKLIDGADNWANINPLPRTVDTGVTVVYQDMADEYTEDWSDWNV